MDKQTPLQEARQRKAEIGAKLKESWEKPLSETPNLLELCAQYQKAELDEGDEEYREILADRDRKQA
jgi:hypothetical protein